MKDLYKRIGLMDQTDNPDQIIAAINNSVAPLRVKESARYILLDNRRKAVYDRNHKLLRTIGQVRANLGLNRTSLWLGSQCADFDCDPSVKGNEQLHQEQTTIQTITAGLQQIYAAFVFLVRVVIWLTLFLCIIGGLLAALYFFFKQSHTKEDYADSTLNDYPIAVSTKNIEVPSYDVGNTNKKYQYTLPAAVKKAEFLHPVIATPFNGQIERYHTAEAIAPFEIKTRAGSGNYFIKLVDYHTKNLILTVFVRGGQAVNFDVPLGTFELKYAVGTVWYGTEYLFGPDTACSKADTILEFRQTGLEVSGYSVELYLQADGNLETERIPLAEF